MDRLYDLSQVRLIDLPSHRDQRGVLTSIEALQHIPFEVKRVFYVHHAVTDRGGHAHIDTDQLIICTSGRMRVTIRNTTEHREFILDSCEKGLFVPRLLFIELLDFKPDTVCTVLASTHYDIKRSLRTWDDYLKFCDVNKSKEKSLEIETWLENQHAAANAKIERIPFEKIEPWYIEESTGDLRHRSGRFFSVTGVSVTKNERKFAQPIITQPEFGILGILVKKIKGEIHFLLQAKVEPGNVNIVQISPTVQATRSNYTQVHGGRPTLFLDFFLDKKKGKTVVDLLQPEQSLYFLKKRNRNVMVEIENEVDLPTEFRWFNAEELRCLISKDNAINMDTRSVLACALLSEKIYTAFVSSRVHQSLQLLNGKHSLEESYAWLTDQKTFCDIRTETIPLKEVTTWKKTTDTIMHCEDRGFRVVMVSSHISKREVSSWVQPLIEEPGIGLAGLLAYSFNNILHFLVRAQANAGTNDIIEVQPTVLCTELELKSRKTEIAFLSELFEDKAQILYDKIQSDEGGRFYHIQNRHLIVELSREPKSIPEGYMWMTMGQISELAKQGAVSMELRSLQICLSLSV